ncbi:ABC transporter ATP-binding protein [Skermanella mucosa]|uniref:ABC transporter ATP-binding protein n=1 Tax=Skermanella mucosa TaxID=1789672 RepID=UPI00192AFEA9|nr:ABC transporter ATP-binding protein [Skermanella mucosa]UEM21604.1 ABC transporter ATP-binding protein [Skermanella mucosa]
MSPLPLLALSGLSVSYGGAPVVDGVSLDVRPGEVLALLGANGAGKSSLLKAVIGLLPAAAGRVLLDGSDITRLAPERRARLGIGYVPEGRRVFPGMSVRDNLEVASFAPAAARMALLDRVFALFPQLRAKSGERAWRLSGGQQQMLAIGRALMGEPRLLLLDEPSLGLSPLLTAQVMATVREIAAGGTAVLLAEQAAARALEAADLGAWLRLGRLAETGSAADLRRRLEADPDFMGNPLATGRPAL